MANFLHRQEEKLSRLEQLKANPTTIIHFCSPETKLTLGHRAVLMGKPGEVLATGFVVRNFRVCRPDEVTDEEFAHAPEIANSLDKILARLSSWKANQDSVQVVRLEKHTV
jgi:hypothetical protein